MRELKNWISEDAGPEATIDALMSVLPYFRIAPSLAKVILPEVESSVASRRDEARSLGMTAIDLNSFADAFENDHRISAQRA
jgi:serine/threonine-protein kinase HipA